MQYVDKIIIFQTKIGFVSGNKKNPLENLIVYSSKLLGKINSYTNQKNIFNIVNIKDMTLITPNSYQENLTMIFVNDKDKNVINEVKEYTEEILRLKNE